jgi:hypothetical protein
MDLIQVLLVISPDCNFAYCWRAYTTMLHVLLFRTSKRSWCVEITDCDVSCGLNLFYNISKYANGRMPIVKLFMIMAMKGVWSIICAFDVIIRICGPHTRWTFWFTSHIVLNQIIRKPDAALTIWCLFRVISSKFDIYIFI